MRYQGLVILIFIIGVLHSYSTESVANSGIVPIPPFAGSFSEGFETMYAGEVPGSQPNLAGPFDILGGQGLLTGVNTEYPVNPFYVWNSIGGFSLDDLTVPEGHVEAVPYDGLQGLHLQTVRSYDPVGRIDFKNPISRFGGYWVHAVTRNTNGPITLMFLGQDDILIDEVEFYYDYVHLRGISQWFGWQSANPVFAVTYTGPWASVDGIQIDPIPEPTSLALFSITAVMLGISRCRVRQV